jgi:hypothetical protein
VDIQKLAEAIKTIEESNGVLRRLIVELHQKKALYPSLEPAINDCKFKLWRSIHAVAQLREEMGLTDNP